MWRACARNSVHGSQKVSFDNSEKTLLVVLDSPSLPLFFFLLLHVPLAEKRIVRKRGLDTLFKTPPLGSPLSGAPRPFNIGKREKWKELPYFLGS